MACRDCAWWVRDSTETRGECHVIKASMPIWFAEQLTNADVAVIGKTFLFQGEGCPQFKERNDGE